MKELYGPLLAVVTASKSAFDAMVRQHSPDGSRSSFIHAAQAHPESKEGQTYRHGLLHPSLPFFIRTPSACIMRSGELRYGNSVTLMS